MKTGRPAPAGRFFPLVAIAAAFGAAAGQPAHGGFPGDACPHALKSAVSLTPLRHDEISYKLLDGPPGAKTIVLIHGLDSAKETFTPIAGELSKKYRVLAYDQRGHGQTVDRGVDFSSEILAKDLKSLLDHLGIEKVVLLGHSMGARTAVRFADLFPGQAEALVIEDMELFRRTRELQILDTDLLEKLKAIPKTYPSREALVKTLEPLYGEEAESLSYRRARQDPDGTLTLLFRPHVSYLYGVQGNAEDLTAALQTIRVPVLALRADPRMGSALSAKGVEQLTAALPSVRVETIEGARHNMHGSKTEELMARLVSFLDSGSFVGGTKPAVAAEGAESHPEYAKLGLAPRGSAVLTGSGKLADSGITAVLHAATGSMTRGGPLFDPTLKSVAASVANSLALARMSGHESVALPFIGGKIFLDRIGVAAETLAHTIVESIVKNRAGLTVKIVAFDAQSAGTFRQALAAFPEAGGGVRVVQGSITEFKDHGCSAIVNAANMELQFGGGVSGVIAHATGEPGKIEQEAARKLAEFYRAQGMK